MTDHDPTGEQASASSSSDGVSWKTIWPLPALALAAVLFGVGMYIAVSTRPRVDTGAILDRAAQLVEAERYDEALEVLNGEMLPHVNSGAAPLSEQARFYDLRAQTLDEAQLALGLDLVENHASVISDISESERLLELAEAGGLNETATMRLARAHVGVDEVDRALELARSVQESSPPAYRGILKRIVSRNLASEDPARSAQSLELLSELALSLGLPPEDRAWVAVHRARVLIAEGRSDEAVLPLLREVSGWDGSASGLADLHVALSEAYVAEEAYESALESLAAAEEVLGPNDPRLARVALHRGLALQAQGSHEVALESFEVAMGGGDPAVHHAAMLALADSLASVAIVGDAEGDAESRAVTAFADVIDLVRRDDVPGLTRNEVFRSLMEQYLTREQAARHLDALRYAELADSMFDEAEVPSEVLLALAVTQWQVVEQALAEAGVDPSDRLSVLSLDEVSRHDLKLRLLRCGSSYLAYADRVLGEAVDAYLNAMWRGADALDRAGDLAAASDAFAGYIAQAPTDDPRLPEATFRHGQVMQAMGDWVGAAGRYEALVERGSGAGDSIGNVGLWAERSVVPLAQCYLRDADAGNDANAETALASFLSGNRIDPTASEYREGLYELATLYANNGRHAPAIERYESFLDRFPEDERRPLVTYRLAGAYRGVSSDLTESVEARRMPPAEESLRRSRATEALERAMDLYGAARAQLEQIESPTSLESLYLRNASLYIGDCAFDLGRYEEAIRLYDDAADRYSDHPSSLQAKAQIISAYVELERWDEAATAQERAATHLRAMEERYDGSIWDDPSVPMGRAHWKRWMDSQNALRRQSRQLANGESVGG